MRSIAFDLEISDPASEDFSWQDKYLGVSCIGVYIVNPLVTSHLITLQGPVQEDGRYADRMTPTQICEFIERLAVTRDMGYRILTFNGLGFDFPFLAAESRSDLHLQYCRDIARTHYDVGFQMFCERGYMIGLDKMAKGLGLPGKLEGMEGKLVPYMWTGKDVPPEIENKIMSSFGTPSGSREAQEIVLKYVRQDAVTTSEVPDGVLESGKIPWVSRSGRKNSWRPKFNLKEGRSLLNVMECLALRKPSTSWMDSPRSRTECCGWLFA